MSEVGPDYLNSKTKRRLDILAGTALAAALIPAGLILAAGCAIDTRSFNPIFTQLRDEGNGNTLRVRKFKTIRSNRLAIETVTHGTFDPRATPGWGQPVRQSGLDEIPQFVSVLDGSMSLVSPRPFLTVDIERMADASPILFDEWHAFYLGAKKGVMGYSNIYRHNFRDGGSLPIYKRSMELDLQYRDTASLALDLKIIGRTPLQMVRASLGTVNNLDYLDEQAEAHVVADVMPDAMQ